MLNGPLDYRYYLDAFIMVSQFLVGLSADEDIWAQSARVITDIFKADIAMFVTKGAEGLFVYEDGGRVRGDQGEAVMQETERIISEVMEKGYFAAELISRPGPFSIAFLPVTVDKKTIAVMLVCRKGADAIDKELLNIYLAVAGLISTALEKRASEETVRKSEKKLRDIAEKVSIKTGDDFFVTLVGFLCRETGMEYALVGEFGEDIRTVRTIAVVGRGEPLQNFECGMEGTAFADAANKRFCIHRDNVRRTFPHDKKLAEFGAESCIGMPLISAADEPLGIIAVLGCGPLKEGAEELVSSLLRILSMRASAELERIRAEQAIRRAEEFISNILQSVDEGFIVLDRQYRIISANRAFSSQVGLPADAVIGRHCYEVSHHVSRPCFETGEDCPTKRTFDTGEPHSVVHTHFDGRGTPLYVETKSYPMRDAHGRIESVIEISINITDKRKLEDQLRQSQKMEAIGTMAGGIAHDFNNILTAIIGYGNLLSMKMAADEPGRPFIDQILSSADKAAQLTQSLLAFSRKQIIDLKPINMNEVVRRVQGLLSRIIGEDIELRTRTSERELIIMADRGQIEQVLMNFATNARDAMPDGGVLTIGTRYVSIKEDDVRAILVDRPGLYAELSVTDTGGGMDEKTRQKIFEPFFSTKEVGKGTGLGLAIVYGIVKQHNGTISVHSDIGIGTTFSIYFPLAKAGAQEPEPLPEGPSLGGSETVLVAEDDAAVRRVIGMTLQGAGYTVIEAVDGEDAASKFASSADKIKVVVSDVIMPRKNGKELYETIRLHRPDVKVLFMSGYTQEILERKGIVGDGIGFIIKPVMPGELLKKLREVLDAS